MTVIRIGHVLTLAVAAVLATGCSSLERELERERNPARTATPEPAPPVVPTDRALPTVAPSEPAAPATACPESGVRIAPGLVQGAMGLRAMTVTLTNCGTRPYELNGYPSVRVLDEDRDPYDITVHQGTDAIPMAGPAPDPAPLTLKPGESAWSGLSWRMMSPDASRTFVEITPAAGERPQTVETMDGPLDLTDTGQLGTTPWQKSD
ncbi:MULTISPECIES: DUF4232 domain-containing protein [unclassified Streptomyces]|uniref:DUF4232 domain-containing protein n=1 Tax=unclassified Streptomyces TaxID=2593676 RepID=UPI0038233620